MNLPYPELVAALGCLVMGSLVAGAEAAVVSLPDARLRAMRDELGEPAGKYLGRYLEDPGRVLTRLLVFRVMTVIVGSVLATNALLPGRAAWWAVAAVSAAVTVIYGGMAEISMTLGRARARRLAPAALRFTRPFEMFVKPIAAPLVAIGRMISERSAAEPLDRSEASIVEREVGYLVEQAENTGGLDRRRVQMLHNVLELKDVTAKDVMVPRTRMHALDVTTTTERAVQIVTEEGHSRIPVYRGQIDNIVGVLHVKDLYRAVERTRPNDGSKPSLETLARKPPFLVTAGQGALSVLKDMQARRTHMAIVVDEYGAVIGLVTLEDILEELVGDIQDEHDSDDPPFVDFGDGRYVASAMMTVTELGEHLGVEFPENETHSSLGGFIAQHAGSVPTVGTVVTWGSYRFCVREGGARHATKVEIIRERRTAPPPDEALDAGS